jgi:hypothetical protein
MFNADKTVAFITTKNMKNLETIGIFAGDEEGWVYQLLAQDKNEIKKLKCYPYQKRITPQQISEFTLEQFLDIIAGGV